MNAANIIKDIDRSFAIVRKEKTPLGHTEEEIELFLKVFKAINDGETLGFDDKQWETLITKYDYSPNILLTFAQTKELTPFATNLIFQKSGLEESLYGRNVETVVANNKRIVATYEADICFALFENPTQPHIKRELMDYFHDRIVERLAFRKDPNLPDDIIEHTAKCIIAQMSATQNDGIILKDTRMAKALQNINSFETLQRIFKQAINSIKSDGKKLLILTNLMCAKCLNTEVPEHEALLNEMFDAGGIVERDTKVTPYMAEQTFAQLYPSDNGEICDKLLLMYAKGVLLPHHEKIIVEDIFKKQMQMGARERCREAEILMSTTQDPEILRRVKEIKNVFSREAAYKNPYMPKEVLDEYAQEIMDKINNNLKKNQDATPVMLAKKMSALLQKTALSNSEDYRTLFSLCSLEEKVEIMLSPHTPIECIQKYIDRRNELPPNNNLTHNPVLYITAKYRMELEKEVSEATAEKLKSTCRALAELTKTSPVLILDRSRGKGYLGKEKFGNPDFMAILNKLSGEDISNNMSLDIRDFDDVIKVINFFNQEDFKRIPNDKRITEYLSEMTRWKAEAYAVRTIHRQIDNATNPSRIQWLQKQEELKQCLDYIESQTGQTQTKEKTQEESLEK